MAGRSYDTRLQEAIAKYPAKDIHAFLNEESLDAEAVDANGQTALHRAIFWRSFRLDVELLLEKGADVNAKDNDGRTPLHFGAKYGRMKTVELLLAKGAKISAQDNKGRTALHVGAILPENTDVVELLLISGLSVNVRDNLGRTPLHHALSVKNDCFPSWDVVKMLLDWGASVSVVDEEGETPIDVTVTRDRFMYILKDHAIKCRAVNFLWNSEYKTMDLSELGIYETSCLEEVERMKKVKFGQHFLYDILFKYGDPTYLTNKKLEKAVNSCYLHSNYPNYSSLLKATYERAKHRITLLSMAQQCFKVLLPAEIVRKILSSVDDEDLQNVIKINNDVT